MDPLKPLPDKSIERNRFSDSNEGAKVPWKELCCKLSIFNEEKLENVEGIVPVNKLKLKSRAASFLKLPNSGGTLPVSKLLDKDIVPNNKYCKQKQHSNEQLWGYLFECSFDVNFLLKKVS